MTDSVSENRKKAAVSPKKEAAVLCCAYRSLMSAFPQPLRKRLTGESLP